MGKKAVSGILSLLVLAGLLTLAFSIPLIEAQLEARKAGVSAGYRVDYGFSVTWESNDPDATIPQYILDSQQLEYFYKVVQSVSGTNVTYYHILHFQNGTERSETRWIYVDTGYSALEAQVVICLSSQPI